MKKQLEIINATFEKVVPKKETETKKGNFWTFLTTTFTTLFALVFVLFVLLFLNPIGWLSIVIMSLLYKFVIS
jgi:hypothetical protein